MNLQGLATFYDNRTILSVLNLYQYCSFPKDHPSLGPEASLNMKTAQTSVNQAFIQDIKILVILVALV